MIKGMTGFGCSQVSDGRIKAVVEIKSVNHRYLDVNFYLPTGFGVIEEKIRGLVQKRVQRGRVSVSFKLVQKPEQTVLFNRDVIRQYLRLAADLKKEFRLDDKLSAADLVALPGVVETRENFVEPQEILPLIEKGVLTALKGLEAMRSREGKSLNADLNANLKRMRAEIKKIRIRAGKILQEKRKVLVDEEFMSFQKSNDINEEIARLTHYIDEFQAALKASSSIGKNLDFVAQEMQRETNTIGSKLQDATVADAVIALKSKIEKIREQAQNVE